VSLAQISEYDRKLVVAQSNESALRDLRNSLLQFFGTVASIFFCYLFFTRIGTLWGPVRPTGVATLPLVVPLIFLSIPSIWLVIRSINRFFGKEIFIFDTNGGVFIRNGFTVGSLEEIRKVTAQVTRGLGQNPMFRHVLELPRCQTVVIATTHYVKGFGEFTLNENGFSDPSKRFAVFEDWTDYDQQNLVPFLPPEIIELQQKILSYLSKPVVK